MTITVYHNPESGHAHRVVAFLSVLGVQFHAQTVDLDAGENRTPGFLELNPLGEVPVLVDEAVVLRDSTAALVYLAKKYDPGGTWLPEEARRAAEVQGWLATSSKDVYESLCKARLSAVFDLPFDYALAVERSETLLRDLFEPHLGRQSWLVGDRPTIADIANYGYVATAPESGISLEPFPNVVAWVRRVEKLEGFICMPQSAAT